MIHAVTKADGVRHLISMATSEHVIMQNEALVALAIASAIDMGKGLIDRKLCICYCIFGTIYPQTTMVG